MSYVISGLPVEDFKPLFGLDDDSLAARGVVRLTVTATGRFPCRVGMRDGQAGETVLLLNYEHQPADTPYRSNYAIYVNESAVEPWTGRDTLPPVLLNRPIALRAFSEDGMLLSAEVVTDGGVEPAIERQLATPGAAYLHAHNAAHGCFAARIDRA